MITGIVSIITQFLVVHNRFLHHRIIAIARGSEIVSAKESAITTRSMRRSISGRRGRSLWNVFLRQTNLGERKNHLLSRGVEVTNGQTRGCDANLRALYAATRHPVDSLGDNLILPDLHILQRGMTYVRVQ